MSIQVRTLLELPVATSVGSSDLLVISQDGITKVIDAGSFIDVVVSSSSLVVNGDLTVLGNESITGTVSGADAWFSHAHTSALTTGLLTVGSAFTVPSLTVQSDATVSGGLTVGQTATVTRDLNVGRDFAVSGTLFSGGVASFGKDIIVNRDAYVSGKLTAGAVSAVNGTLNLQNLNVANQLTVGGTFYTEGSTNEFVRSVTFDEDISVSGKATIGGRVSVASLNVIGAVSANGDIFGRSGIIADNDATIRRDAFISRDATVGRDFGVSGTLFAGGTASFSRDIIGARDAAVSGKLTVGKLRGIFIPTSSGGLASGDIWNNAGVLNIVP